MSHGWLAVWLWVVFAWFVIHVLVDIGCAGKPRPPVQGGTLIARVLVCGFFAFIVAVSAIAMGSW